MAGCLAGGFRNGKAQHTVVPAEQSEGRDPVTPVLKVRTGRGYWVPAFAGTTAEKLNLPQHRKRVAGAFERVAGLTCVGHHVALEGFDRSEFLLMADPADEGDVDRLPIQV